MLLWDVVVDGRGVDGGSVVDGDSVDRGSVAGTGFSLRAGGRGTRDENGRSWIGMDAAYVISIGWFLMNNRV